MNGLDGFDERASTDTLEGAEILHRFLSHRPAAPSLISLIFPPVLLAVVVPMLSQPVVIVPMLSQPVVVGMNSTCLTIPICAGPAPSLVSPPSSLAAIGLRARCTTLMLPAKPVMPTIKFSL